MLCIILTTVSFFNRHNSLCIRLRPQLPSQRNDLVTTRHWHTYLVIVWNMFTNTGNKRISAKGESKRVSVYIWFVSVSRTSNGNGRLSPFLQRYDWLVGNYNHTATKIPAKQIMNTNNNIRIKKNKHQYFRKNTCFCFELLQEEILPVQRWGEPDPCLSVFWAEGWQHVGDWGSFRLYIRVCGDI